MQGSEKCRWREVLGEERRFPVLSCRKNTPGGGQLGDGTQAAEPSHPRPSQATLEQPTGGQAQSRMVTPLNHVTLTRDAHASKIGAP